MSELKKRNRGSDWVNPDNGVTVNDHDKQRILTDAMSQSSLFNPKIGRPLLDYSVDEVERRVKDYFLDCVDKGRRPTLTGMASALDVCYDTYLNWTRDTSRPYHSILQRARLLIQNFEEQMTLEGKTNLIYGIFRDKSRWNFVEKQEFLLTPNQPNPLGETLSPTEVEALIQRYLNALPEEDDE